MEFTKRSADPRLTVWENEHHEQVVITVGKKPVRASGRLMVFQIDAVVAANKRGETYVEVGDINRNF